MNSLKIIINIVALVTSSQSKFLPNRDYQKEYNITNNGVNQSRPFAMMNTNYNPNSRVERGTLEERLEENEIVKKKHLVYHPKRIQMLIIRWNQTRMLFEALRNRTLRDVEKLSNCKREIRRLLSIGQTLSNKTKELEEATKSDDLKRKRYMEFEKDSFEKFKTEISDLEHEAIKEELSAMTKDIPKSILNNSAHMMSSNEERSEDLANDILINELSSKRDEKERALQNQKDKNKEKISNNKSQKKSESIEDPDLKQIDSLLNSILIGKSQTELKEVNSSRKDNKAQRSQKKASEDKRSGIRKRSKRSDKESKRNEKKDLEELEMIDKKMRRILYRYKRTNERVVGKNLKTKLEKSLPDQEQTRFNELSSLHEQKNQRIPVAIGLFGKKKKRMKRMVPTLNEKWGEIKRVVNDSKVDMADSGKELTDMKYKYDQLDRDIHSAYKISSPQQMENLKKDQSLMSQNDIAVEALLAKIENASREIRVKIKMADEHLNNLASAGREIKSDFIELRNAHRIIDKEMTDRQLERQKKYEDSLFQIKQDAKKMAKESEKVKSRNLTTAEEKTDYYNKLIAKVLEGFV